LPSLTGIESAGKRHIDQLTALRGLACLFVLAGHVIQVFNYRQAEAGGVSWWSGLLIRGLFNAEGAVLLFFVLSGCVLAMSLQQAGRLGGRVVAGFYIRRLFRLYPLLWLSTFMAIAGVMAARPVLGKDVFAGWLQGNLQAPVTVVHTLLSMAGIWTKYDGPMWSLRVELIYSALFPAIYLLVSMKRSRGWFIAACLGLAVLPVGHPQYGTAFALAFGLGALIPFTLMRAAKTPAMVVIAAAAILCYDRTLLGAFHPPEIVHDLIETLASFVIVLDIYAGRREYRALACRPVIRVGELSFGIYLLHLPILVMIFVALQHFTGPAALLDHPAQSQIMLGVLTAGATIPLSYLTYKYIESPLHRYGRRLAGKIAGERPADQHKVKSLSAGLSPLA